VSVAIMPPLGGILAELGGWRWSFAPFGLALVSAAAVFRYVQESSTGGGHTFGEQIRGAVVVVRQPVVLGSILFGAVFFVLAFGLMLTALPLMLQQRFGLSVGVRGLVFVAPAIGATIVALNMGRLRRRFGARLLLVAGAALFALGYLAMGWGPLLAVVVLGAFIHGLGEGGVIPTVQELVASASPNESRGAVMAVWVGFARLGQTIGPLLAGVSVAAVGFTTTFGFGLVAAAALAVGTAVLGARLRPAAADVV